MDAIVATLGPKANAFCSSLVYIDDFYGNIIAVAVLLLTGSYAYVYMHII